MPINNDLLDAIQMALGALVTPSLTSNSAISDLFEAYILGIILDAAIAEGASIEYRDVQGQVTSQFVFRSSPGYIFSDERLYTHAVIDFPTCPLLEAHMGRLYWFSQRCPIERWGLPLYGRYKHEHPRRRG